MIFEKKLKVEKLIEDKFSEERKRCVIEKNFVQKYNSEQVE